MSMAKESKNRADKEPIIGFSLVTPPYEDNYIFASTDTLEFSGTAPGKMVYLHTGQAVLGTSKIENLDWKIEVGTDVVMDKDVTLVARDEDGKLLEKIGPLRVGVDSDLRERLEKTSKGVSLPVEITKPQNEETVSGRVAIFGTGVPRTRVKIYLNKEQIGSVNVDDDGQWRHVHMFRAAGRQRLSAVTSPNDISTIEFNVAEEN